jgi:hypothetical protein
MVKTGARQKVIRDNLKLGLYVKSPPELLLGGFLQFKKQG